MRTILVIARKEIQEGLRNRWVLATTLLLATLALTLTFLGSAPTGNVGASALDVIVVSLSSLSVFLVPLIALLISHDAIVGEAERGTLLLLLSYPLARFQVIAGKFIGHLAILAFATLIGYGAAALALGLGDGAGLAAGWPAFALLIGSSVLLGAVFIAIGYLVSTLAGERGTAGGIAVGVWLVFVLVYDMALLGLLVADQGRTVTGGLLNALLLLNPTDAYRLLNLGGEAGAISGMAGAASLSAPALVAALALWAALPLAAAMLVFSRREA
ncbi:ABC transporter permease subunit [Shinella sp.]|uniref:ABC transporter permease subunit n=1 Tax=Shinella sp. TaxID=1870904 RepID=UPI00258B86DE|nr:ABC transporter permease subunit [Shinella sp.]MCW5709422.1 ABC transporter permease [Shinella sp.]